MLRERHLGSENSCNGVDTHGGIRWCDVFHLSTQLHIHQRSQVEEIVDSQFIGIYRAKLSGAEVPNAKFSRSRLAHEKRATVMATGFYS